MLIFFPQIHLLKLGSIGEDQWTERSIAQCKLIQQPKETRDNTMLWDMSSFCKIKEV